MIKNKTKGKFKSTLRSNQTSISKLTMTQLLRKENRDLLAKDVTILENDGKQLAVCFPIDFFMSEFGGFLVLKEKGFDVDRLTREWTLLNKVRRDGAMEAL
jgi:hypothetical protein